MGLLNEQQCNRAVEVMNEYLSAPLGQDGKTPIESSAKVDVERIKTIENDLKPLLLRLLNGNTNLLEFKSKVDSLNKLNPYWGFSGIKGQMFFNMVVNVADDMDDMDECEQELKLSLKVPENEQIASSRIKNLTSYIKRLGEQWVEAGNRRYGSPKVGSIPFFLSYFWHIQDRDKWPIYYTNSVQVMTDLNLWQPSEDLAQDYLTFKHIFEELEVLFTRESNDPFNLYKVEHVFWYKGGNPYLEVKNNSKTVTKSTPFGPTTIESILRLPESYVPPIIAILPRMANNEEDLVEAAKRSGTSLPHAFEKNINAVFTILGYETKLLGQGKGRVPDGIAFVHDESYAILWDAKIRTDRYGIGTDDRTIREYITTQSRDLKKRRSLRNIYYLIISSSFANDYDDTIRSIKMETNVNEVSLVEADALVAMVDIKLREPLQLTLGPDGLQRLFSNSGIIKAEMVREQLQ
jgi:hypothetical protein